VKEYSRAEVDEVSRLRSAERLAYCRGALTPMDDADSHGWYHVASGGRRCCYHCETCRVRDLPWCAPEALSVLERCVFALVTRDD
jgi:hypothetical protein